MTEYKEMLNSFFVDTFNNILSWEEKSIKQSGLKGVTVKELHAIEAAHILEKSRCNTMSQIAAKLGISVGALTTAMNSLVKKGFLYRKNDPLDRRIVYICLTEEGSEILKIHETFHEEMIDKVTKDLSPEALQSLTDSLSKLREFFKKCTE